MNVFTENHDFYPTPRAVVERMLMGEDVAGKTILEPSAGKGDICTVLREFGASNILVCENDEHNRKLLKGKYDEFLCDDFLQLTAERVSHVNMIVMNPPFSRGAEHINHAFEIAPPGCTVIALCNSANFTRSFRSGSIKLMEENIANYGSRENLQSCFDTAERKTDVQVSLIKLYKEGEGSSEFAGYMFENVDSDPLNGNHTKGIVGYNLVRELVNRYVSAVRMFDETMEAAKRINDMARFDDPEDNGKPEYWKANIPIKFDAVKIDNKGIGGKVTRNIYKKELKRYYWGIIFRKLNMEKYTTQELREQLNKFIETQGCVPFTMYNVYKVIDMVIQTNGQRMRRALTEVFDRICALSAQNSTAGEKWKTNSNYMVNRRFIANYIGDYDARWPREYVTIRYGGNADIIDDFCRALCWLTATNYDDIGNFRSCAGYKDDKVRKWGEWFEWGFFRVRVYKKGTAHFEFLDEKIWQRFNMEVAKSKGWKLGSKEDKTRKPRKNKEAKEDTTVPAVVEYPIEAGTEKTEKIDNNQTLFDIL
ncbi:DUF4942 domain-containing protein [Palleniella muris]|uniref:DUF4942 domain-containing protein n=1 Tax=Palleniella muris TaxID=3038145 RepID=A0AC61QMF6_9BACT|nr:DUF4942 domain-containing protein [Palleniella muris]TGX80502.1 DUF4942 domain-containing protein [Palleniella muris]